MSYFDFKLNSLYIKNNRDINKAELQIFSFVTNGASRQDLFNGLLDTQNKEERVALIKSAAEILISDKQIINIQNIPDNFRMNFGLNGISLYRAKEIPEYFDWSFAVFDSDEEVRLIGRKMKDFLHSPSFDLLSNNIIAAIGVTATPQIYAAVKVSEIIGKFVAEELSNNRDDQICVYCESFNRYENYPHLNLKGVDIDDLSGNCKVSYSIFGVETHQ